MIEIGLLVALGLGLFAFLAALNEGWIRVFAAVAVAPLYAAIIYAIVSSLGYPVRIDIPPETPVVWHQLDEPRAIYVLADIKGEPRLYVLPWTEATAEQLTHASRQAGDGGKIAYGRAYDSVNSEPMFHGTPPEALPPKELQ